MRSVCFLPSHKKVKLKAAAVNVNQRISRMACEQQTKEKCWEIKRWIWPSLFRRKQWILWDEGVRFRLRSEFEQNLSGGCFSEVYSACCSSNGQTLIFELEVRFSWTHFTLLHQGRGGGSWTQGEEVLQHSDEGLLWCIVTLISVTHSEMLQLILQMLQ